MTPAALLKEARDLLEQPAAVGIGAWPRAVALLTRQALEQALEEFWQGQQATAGLWGCPMRTQLTCLPAYLEPRLAREVSYVWAALSNACHYHPYDLAPTATELTGWMRTVTTLITSIGENLPHRHNGPIAAGDRQPRSDPILSAGSTASANGVPDRPCLEPRT
jgi:hypothetical protein